MAIDYDRLRRWAIPDQRNRYGQDDCIRYALSLGMGADPLDALDLPFVYEGARADAPMPVMPTLLSVVGAPGAWATDPGTGIDWMQILHGEHRMRFHAPLPPAAEVLSRTQVCRVVDKGAGRGALVVTERQVSDAASGRPLATVEHVSFCRADGGFATPGQPGDAALPALPALPQRPADLSWDMPTLASAALLYRLNGDRNPIHASPEAARSAGFERPILHGLCTFGMAARALVRLACGNDPARLASIAARFSAPVVPGDTLTAQLWHEGGDAWRFAVWARERQCMVLSHGTAEVLPA
ncbi:Acyl dehydratase [Oryzisolibacter propanilivorax]|uniref:Acyl dehydratase n=1 Tax=Oryzisolibacter propanilivorax TaxID=1527607 RepID=A0A1G9Q480_9BURK|nr:MaoC/PaaZ C-terminal domain-containing protein [Oryzisolibacter propanilivorax]SDM05723.1 Acyl dehydratase [Oryzisolibacter propanilivorax]